MILSDNLWKVMYRVSWPAVIAMVLYGLNTVFDAVFVGIFETALAGVSIAYPLAQITLGLGSLIGVGAGSALSISLGAKDEFTQKRLLGNVNYLTIVISAVYMVVAFLLATPSLIMTVMTLVQAVVVFNALARYGTTYDLALYGAIYRIFTLLLTPIFGLMRALQPVIGINYGARNNFRVISSFKIFAVASTLLMLPFWLILMLMPEAALGLMFQNKVFDGTSLLYFRVHMALLPILPVIFMAMTFYPAVNNGKPAGMIGIARQLVFYVPVMLILPKLFGIKWVYYGTFLIDTVITAWVFILIRKEFKILRESQENAIF